MWGGGKLPGAVEQFCRPLEGLSRRLKRFARRIDLLSQGGPCRASGVNLLPQGGRKLLPLA